MSTTTSIDAAGRVVIPKAIRDSLRLQAGDVLDVRVENDGITLRPQQAEVPLVQEMGVWVYRTGRRLTDSIPDLIDAAREERARGD